MHRDSRFWFLLLFGLQGHHPFLVFDPGLLFFYVFSWSRAGHLFVSLVWNNTSVEYNMSACKSELKLVSSLLTSMMR